MNINTIKFFNVPNGDHKKVLRTDENLAIQMTKFSENFQNKSVLFFWKIWTTRDTSDWSKRVSLFRTVIFENKHSLYLKNIIKALSRFLSFRHSSIQSTFLFAGIIQCFSFDIPSANRSICMVYCMVINKIRV